MSSKRSPQTAAKREREFAVKEKRKRKLEKKLAAAAERNGGGANLAAGEGVEAAPEAEAASG
jgi:hypothetical protein